MTSTTITFLFLLFWIIPIFFHAGDCLLEALGKWKKKEAPKLILAPICLGACALIIYSVILCFTLSSSSSLPLEALGATLLLYDCFALTGYVVFIVFCYYWGAKEQKYHWVPLAVLLLGIILICF